VLIVEDASVYGARQAIREVGAALGFDGKSVAELVLIASELCTNILKHAGRGELHLRPVHDAALGAGVELVARDQGPPIADFEEAQRDGWSGGQRIDPVRFFGRKGIGAGLGSIRRLSDELRYEQLGVWKEISARRFVSRPRSR
jgi:anti-sigma regulatory factor (Ser/Thr protein kinase)